MKNSRIAKLIGIGLLVIGMFGSVLGQQHTENKADQTLRGSGRVNPSTLGMEFDLPLGSYSGRGINIPIGLSYSSKVWRMDFQQSFPRAGLGNQGCIAINKAKFAEDSASGWTSSMQTAYVEYSGLDNLFNSDGFPLSEDCFLNGSTNNNLAAYIRRIQIHLPSGESHELRMDDNPLVYDRASNCSTPGAPCDPWQPTRDENWNGWYYAVDGSNLRYFEDRTNDIYILQYPDGSQYKFENDFNFDLVDRKTIRKATLYKDRNGNQTTYHVADAQHPEFPNGYWIDTMGKAIGVPLPAKAPANAGIQDYKMPSFNGGWVTYKLNWKQLKGNTAAESGLTDFNQTLRYHGNKYLTGNTSGAVIWGNRENFLFNSQWEAYVLAEGIFNPIVLTEIELPTGQKYKFSYDIYGKIEAIKYPTGGEEQFVYAPIIPLTMSTDTANVTDQANFGVVDRKVLEAAGDSTPYQTTYSVHYVEPGGYAITTTNPDATKNVSFLHRGNGASPGSSTGTFGYDNGLTGMEYEQRSFDSLGNIVSKGVKRWTVSPFQFSIPYSGGTFTAHWHPRIEHEETSIFETSGNGVSSTTKFEYEGNLGLIQSPVLQNKTLQYEFVSIPVVPFYPSQYPNPYPTPVPTPVPPTLLRTSETQYLQSDPSIPQSTKDAYKAQNIVGLATASVVKDAAGTIVSRSEMSYDDATYSPNIGRGNPTTSRVWDSTKGNHDNPNAYIATHAKFDVYGNQTESTDAKGLTTYTAYSATYGYAFPTTVTTSVPDPTGLSGSNTAFTTSVTYDPTTGLPLTTTDANNQTTTMEYDAVTLRPKKVTPPTGAGISETIYHDEPNNYWVKNRSQIDATNWAESITYFDGLGRAKKAEKVDAQGNIFTETEFDYAGRPLRTTNPYRANELKMWTTNIYDESSRIKEVMLPDGAKVKTDYGVSITGVIGFTKQITDQAGKKRKGITDALGRMVRVIEDPTGQNLATDYVFDTLGNLRKTIQGEQSRYFTFDSLGRLMYAKQPEQDANAAFALTDSITGNTAWSVKYQYDDNGNIVSTTDAKGVSVTATYDNFNRLKVRDYSDTTPDVNFYYDGKYSDINNNVQIAAGSVKGKTTGIKSSVSKTNYTNFDNLGKLLTHQQITDGNIYTSSYQYDAFGTLKSETYPSGRTVKMDYNSDGEIASIWGTKGTQNTLYANAVSYNSAGAMERLKLGNGKWETASYNGRLQVTQIGLGNSASDKSLLKIDYDYGNNLQNNGSLREQKINYSGLANEIKQNYGYDDLNRLQTSTETVNSQVTWQQSFSFDRYGNRRFDGLNTNTLGQSSTKITNPQINTSDNRLKKDQDNDTITDYDYDKVGNMTLDAENKRFIYDAENHIKSFFNGTNSSNTPDATYFYDGEGRRIKKISDTETTIFVYNGGGTLIAEYSTKTSNQPKVSFLTADHLGSPRIVTDQTGKVISRHDYLAFGDEVTDTLGNVGGRNSAHGYGAEDDIRKQYTGYEKDEESGLDFAQARYYNGKHGRFTSVDPLVASANVKDPQTFNRYSYVLNSPYKFSDPLGLLPESKSGPKDKTANCDFACRMRSGNLQSKEDFRLMQFHVENGTALGYAYLNAQETRQSEAAIRRTASLNTINKIIDRSFGVGSITLSGKKVTKAVKGLVKRLKRDAAILYDLAVAITINPTPKMIFDDEQKQNISSSTVLRNPKDPEFEAQFNAWGLSYEFADKTFNAKNKKGNIGVFFYGQEDIEAVTLKIFERTIDFGYSDGQIELDDRLDKKQEFMRKGRMQPQIME
jgi:RHS repeat-associated protein